MEICMKQMCYMIQLYHSLGHIHKRLYHKGHRHLLIHIHCCSNYLGSKWKQLKCLSADEWIMKMWYIYTLEYYSVVKKMRYSRPRKTSIICSLLSVDVSFKISDICTPFRILIEIRKLITGHGGGLGGKGDRMQWYKRLKGSDWELEGRVEERTWKGKPNTETFWKCHLENCYCRRS